jgi:hypothetical protein
MYMKEPARSHDTSIAYTCHVNSNTKPQVTVRQRSAIHRLYFAKLAYSSQVVFDPL